MAKAPRAAVALALLLRGRDGGSSRRRWWRNRRRIRCCRPGRTPRPGGRGRVNAPCRSTPSHRSGWDVNGAILRIVLNLRDRHNASSVAMRDELVTALRLALADPGLRVVLSGRGPSFSSGGDLAEFGTFPDPATAHLVRLMRSGRAFSLASAIGSRPTSTARVSAPASSSRPSPAGSSRRDAVFGLPEVPLGLVPGAGGAASLPPRIGRQRTALLALTGVHIDAPQALGWGTRRRGGRRAAGSLAVNDGPGV